MKFNKKTWTNGLTAAELNILIGRCPFQYFIINYERKV